MVKGYLASAPDPSLYEFLQQDFDGLTARHGGVVGTTFKNFPSFPQRYMERVNMPSSDPMVKIEPLKRLTQPALYTEDDLHVRQFTEASARRLTRKGQHRAA
jgi:hypothetical protein